MTDRTAYANSLPGRFHMVPLTSGRSKAGSSKNSALQKGNETALHDSPCVWGQGESPLREAREELDSLRYWMAVGETFEAEVHRCSKEGIVRLNEQLLQELRRDRRCTARIAVSRAQAIE